MDAAVTAAASAVVKIVAAGLAVVVLFAVLVTSAATAILGGSSLASCTGDTTADAASVLPLDDEQTANVRTMLDVATDLDLPPRAAVIAVATAWQESGLRNLDHGDADSIGLFQQRPSTGWGSMAADTADHRSARQRLLDPVYDANAFYTALVKVKGWQELPLTEAAQAVERSAHPNAYARWEQPATRVVSTLTARACLSVMPGSNAEARTAIDYARAQIGLPYQWGGDGPAAGDRGFDCSGLTRAAYAAAGIDLPRTAQAQFDREPRLPAGTEPAPGDLVFFGTSPSHVTHVGIYIGSGQMIDAPHTGAMVRIENYGWKTYLATSRPHRDMSRPDSPAGE